MSKMWQSFAIQHIEKGVNASNVFLCLTFEILYSDVYLIN